MSWFVEGVEVLDLGLDVEELFEAVEVVEVAFKDFLPGACEGGHADFSDGEEVFLALLGFSQDAEVGEFFPAVFEC